jgi:xylan 1,4-beta-xylosidase
VAGPDAAVTLSIEGLGLKQGKAKLQQFRIDATHSNGFTAWQRIGSPASPTAAQYKQLEAASELALAAGSPSSLDVVDSRASMTVALPRQAVSLFVLEW